ncbi:unnamed protein product [Leptidea sinapis]|uniref:CBF1-interacting co-repressor CIR N-terminal domain-containing protein n=1 Tax=Leptidea sinapis TaxID=189913 RepID=A0A5E4Q3D5_9NEOP|nr:unnamed protein product [Leptidea sinapis]
MGGGDLNSKKSWHPSTLKNQERVWKAEQAAAEEKKRILELQHERAEEKDRDELNSLVRKNFSVEKNLDDKRLDWMYNKPDKQVQQEEYLLGRAIGKSHDQSGKSDQPEIPAVARRVVGSSMITAASDVQVDLARKLREDPLLLVQERERAARAALLNNPVQRRRLTELLRKEQEANNQKKAKKKHKKKDKDLDNILAAKLNALGSDKIDLSKLLESDDSSDESSSSHEKSKKKKKKKKSKKESKEKKKDKKKSKHKTENDESDKSRKRKSSDFENEPRDEQYSKKQKRDVSDDYNKCSSSSKPSKYNERDFKKPHSDKGSERRYGLETFGDKQRSHYKDRKEYTTTDDKTKTDHSSSKKIGLSAEEKAARLAEMAAAGAEREVQRGRKVAAQLAEKEIEEKLSKSRLPARSEARALPDSLESRIHSNRHYIQRDKRQMNENFARR